MDCEQLKAMEKTYVMSSYGRYDVFLEGGKGATLYGDGKEYIDFAAGIGVLSLGTAHPAWLRAVAEQSAKLAHVSNLFYSEPMITLAYKLCQATGLSKVFFANSGAEANEGAIKIARKYSFDHYGPGRAHIVTLRNSFHGRTIATLSATGQDRFHHYFFPFLEGFSYVEANDVPALEAAVTEQTCAVMIELIQGEGGVNVLDEAYVRAVAALCKGRDLLLIIDEIQTGIGRTGSLFAFSQYGIEPDLVTSAKGLAGGLPIGAVLSGAKCADTLTAGTHGATFGGNPVACAAAAAVLDIVTQPSFLAEVKQKGQYLRDTVAAWQLPAVRAIRGRGLMIGLEVAAGQHKAYVARLAQKGLLALTAGSAAIRFLPPLVINQEEIDRGLVILKDVLAQGL